MANEDELSGRVAVITGASRGIGRAVAKALARRGAQVVAIARTSGALEELDDEIQAETGRNTSLVPLDLTDFDAIDRLGGTLAERFKRTDIIVGNAGVLGDITPLAHLEPKVWQDLVNVNITANWRLIRAFDPLLRASDAGRALFTTSGITQRLRAYWGGYAMSKAALEAMVLTYAQEVRNTPLKVNMINPGATRTRMRAKAMPGEDPETLPTPEDVAELFAAMAAPGWTGHGEIVNYREWRDTPA